jgi:hypothetical protein
VSVTYLAAVAGAVLFGAGIQYLGSLTAGSVLGTWTWTVSGMSAPWLVLPFVAGMTQERRRRAMALGVVVTLAALVGYFAMAHSPFEGAPVDEFFDRFMTQVRTGYNLLWIVAGLASGSLYGFLGYRWRVARWSVSAIAVAAAVCLEPLARRAVGMLSGRALTWAGEMSVGIVMGLGFAYAIIASRRNRHVSPPA